MAQFDYFGVRCKTAGCAHLIPLHCTGQHKRFAANTIQKPEQDKIDVRCPACSQINSYQSGDIIGFLGPEPPPDFASHPAFQSKTNS